MGTDALHVEMLGLRQRSSFSTFGSGSLGSLGWSLTDPEIFSCEAIRLIVR